MPLRAWKKGVELWDSVSIYIGQKTLKHRHGWLGCESGHIILWKDWKGCLIVTRRELGQSPKRANSTLLKCRSALQKFRLVPLGVECSLVFGCLFYYLFRVFFYYLVLAPRRVFILSLWFLSLFWIIQAFFRSNYLVDKYPKINLDKVWIIHNFIFIQSSFLFLCRQSYFKQ